jgi:hypothetical protein
VIRNITLSAEDKLISAARLRARQHRTTLNDAFRDWLHRYVGSDAAPNRYRRIAKQLKHVSAGRKFSRDEMNER